MVNFKQQLPLGFRARWALIAAWNRALDVLCAPVLAHLTHDEYFTSRTRRQAIGKFVRRGAWFGNRAAQARCLAQQEADNAAWEAANPA